MSLIINDSLKCSMQILQSVKLTHSQKLLLCYLIENAPRNPSYETITNDLGTSMQTVKNGINALVKNKLILKIKNPGFPRSGNRYELKNDAINAL